MCRSVVVLSDNIPTRSGCVLQCVAVCCRLLRCVAVYCHCQAIYPRALPVRVAECCDVLQCAVVVRQYLCALCLCVAARCSVLRYVAVCCSVLPLSDSTPARSACVVQCFAVFCSLLRCVAVDCSVLQCVTVWQRDAVCHRVLQSVAVCCSVLQFVAVCCSILHLIAVCCSVSSFSDNIPPRSACVL